MLIFGSDLKNCNASTRPKHCMSFTMLNVSKYSFKNFIFVGWILLRYIIALSKYTCNRNWDSCYFILVYSQHVSTLIGHPQVKKSKTIYNHNILSGARGSIDGRRAMLQAARSRVLVPMRSLNFLKLRNHSSSPKVYSPSDRNEYQKIFVGAKPDRRVRLSP
jgi:hypothetical protein